MFTLCKWKASVFQQNRSSFRWLIPICSIFLLFFFFLPALTITNAFHSPPVNVWLVVSPRHADRWWNGSAQEEEKFGGEIKSQCCQRRETFPERIAINIFLWILWQEYFHPLDKVSLFTRRCQLSAFPRAFSLFFFQIHSQLDFQFPHLADSAKRKSQSSTKLV